MKNVFINFEESSNYVAGWGSSPVNDRDIEMELPEEHEIFSSFLIMQSYKLENGVLVKDIHKEAELLAGRAAQKNEPSEQEIIEKLQKENERLTETLDTLAFYVLMGGE